MTLTRRKKRGPARSWAHRLPAARRRLRQIEALHPQTEDELHRLVRVMFGMHVPRRALVPGNDAPFEYLVHAFFEGMHPEVVGENGDSSAGEESGVLSPGELGSPTSPGGRGGGSPDVVVWANRGGGKTMLGAVATVLDLLFKPGVQVRILGGSFEQSDKMYRYMLGLLDRPALRPTVVREPTQKRLELASGSAVEVLRQSPRSVRGHRVHKMRCDEVEEFKDDVWDAAQLVTHSQTLGGREVRGSVEALSTMHRTYGLMSRLVDPLTDGRSGDGEQHEGDGGAAHASRRPPRVLRWSAMDVIERCPPARACDECVLWSSCLGRAKEAEGFMKVDDLVDQWHRSSDRRWASEMMCLRPSREDNVYADFDPTPGGPHVSAVGPGGGGPSALVAGLRGDCQNLAFEGGARLNLSQSGSLEPDAAVPKEQLEKWFELRKRVDSRDAKIIAGIDLGMRSPMVMLWARVRPPERGGWHDQPEHYRVEVVGEYQEDGLILPRHLDRIGRLGWPKPAWVGVDPSGGNRNAHSGRSDLEVLRKHGYTVRAKRSSVEMGVEMIRRRLDRGTLTIDASCQQLIRAMSQYHFASRDPHDQRPVKDGPDHACDALRYMIVNLELGSTPAVVKNYVTW